jgi:hypothetical protein
MFPSIGRDTFKGKDGEEILVSTIYFNMDWAPVTRPEDHRYYETMIFGGEHDGYQECHATEEEAVVEHARAFALVEKSLKEKTDE